MVFMKTEDGCMTYDREVYIYVYISRRREDGRTGSGRLSALTVGFCLMKRREADSAAVIYLGVRMESR